MTTVIKCRSKYCEELAGYFWMYLIVPGLIASGLALALADRSSVK